MKITRSAWLVSLALLTGAAKEPAMKNVPAVETVAGLIEFAPPAGWSRTAYSNTGGIDLVVAFERGMDRLVVQVFGAKGSFHKDPTDFFAGPGATTMGRAPEKKGEALVAGKPLALFRRRFPLLEGGPHDSTPGTPKMGAETFCILPPFKDGRFIVLSLQRESPVPDIERTGEKAWKSFLRGVRRSKVPGSP
ncbi:MAG: hypothetical protein A2V88_13390 [Elusimicrobia bacterium RBG_16_66_12]|nr:MAG: hypothetical protein A2V88_13390 [Elusimicrobia bacterium RBG_16_66_12]